MAEHLAAFAWSTTDVRWQEKFVILGLSEEATYFDKLDVIVFDCDDEADLVRLAVRCCFDVARVREILAALQRRGILMDGPERGLTRINLDWCGEKETRIHHPGGAG